MDEPSHLRDARRRTRRSYNDARVASHTAWVLRMDALEIRMRTAALARENRELVARVRAAG